MSIFESNSQPSGDRATETAYRRIELQSPADFHYLVDNVRQAAYRKLDVHLPPDATAEKQDAMRAKVESLVEEYIIRIFEAAKGNISINGMHSDEMEAEFVKASEGEETEPFDAKLAQRVQALSAQIEHQTLHLATLRRSAPSDAARKFLSNYEQQVQEQDGKLAETSASRLQKATSTSIGVEEFARVGEMQETWQRSVGQLKALTSGVTETVGEMEKALKAASFVVDDSK